MVDDETQSDSQDDETIENVALAVTSDYKVLGEFTDSTGAGVLGQNNAASRTPIGVRGATPNASTGYGLYSDDDAYIDENLDLNGNLDAGSAFNVYVSGAIAASIHGTDNDGNAGKVELGHENNEAASDGGTVGGGGSSNNTSQPNKATGNYSTVSGGRGNVASGPNGTVGGGDSNLTNANFGTASGGGFNVANGFASTISGGTSNRVRDDNGTSRHSTVGGGEHNRIKAGDYATISGGGPSDTNDKPSTRNLVFDNYCTIGGGGNNQAGSDDGEPEDPSNAEYATVSGGRENGATGSYSSVGGGFDNDTSESYATISGGRNNNATFTDATVGGGNDNTASGWGSTVPGGNKNTASGGWSFAAGEYAKAADENSFVWNDGSGESDSSGSKSDQFSSSTTASGPTGSNTFHVKATSGVRFVTDAGNNDVTYISGGSAGWSNTSTRTAKTNIDPVDPGAILDGVASMEIATWEYRDEDGDGRGERHIGPMAEQFHETVDVGDSDEHINSINADGVLFAAVQGLSEKLDEKDERIDELEANVAERDETIDEQADRIDTLEDRLDALEAQVERTTADD